MQEINLRLAIDDVNVILEGVGNLPFAKVYTLVGKIQEQAAQQIRADRTAVKTQTPGADPDIEAAR
jgi:hypothetical protein